MERSKIKNVSVRKKVDKKFSNFETDRKLNRFPLIKGTNFHSSAFSSMNQRRQVLSCHENAEVSEKNLNFNDRIISGQTCKIIENDDKAKKYLQKVIQNRNCIIHFHENRSNKISREFKENIEDLLSMRKN